MSECKAFRREFEEAADGGALGPRAAAHAESCAACGEELRGRERLRGLVRGLGRVEAPPDFEFRLRARMAGSRPGGGGGLFAGLFPVSGLAWAALAVCVLSVTAAVYFRRAQPARPSASNGGEVASAPQVHASPAAVESNDVSENATRQTDAGKTVAFVGKAPALTPRGAGVRRVVSRSRERELFAREPRVDSTQGGSVDTAVRTAQVRLPLFNSGADAASNAPAQGIQLGTSAGTLRVVLRDERGTLVPMRTVSFGSQEPLSRQTASSGLSKKDDEGVW